MKKLYLYAFVILALVVVINFAIRGATPQFHPGEALPSLANHEWIAGILAGFAKPGLYGLWNLGLNVNARPILCLALLVSWWVWLSLARLVWTIVGRAFGVICVADFHWWLMFTLPWRPFYRQWLRVAAWWKQFKYGKGATGGWAGTLTVMTRVFKRGDCIFPGLLWWCGFGLFQPVGIKDPRHVNIVAGSGAGKTTYATGWLGMIDDSASALVVDTDALMVNALGPGLERAGHDVFNLDPYHLSRFPGACWNPIIELDRAAERHGRQAVVRFAATLAEALVQESNSNQRIFADVARGFILSLCLYVWLFADEALRTLVRVRDLLARGAPELVTDPKQDPFDALLLHMIKSPMVKDDGCEGTITAAIARGASAMKSGQRPREGNPFKTTAISATAWLDFPEIATLMQRSDFACEDLKTGNPCLFIVIPVSDIQTKLAGLPRALVMMAAYAFENMPGSLEVPSLWLIDEMPNLGRIEAFETARAVFRRFGIRLVIMMQDIGRLKQAYPDSWESFFGNAALTLIMGGGHFSTFEYFSKIISMATREDVVELSDAPPRVDKRDVSVINPNQLAEFLDPSRRQLVGILPGKPAMRLAWEPYYLALPVWKYEADPKFRERRLRAFTRRIVNWLWVPKAPRGPRRP